MTFRTATTAAATAARFDAMEDTDMSSTTTDMRFAGTAVAYYRGIDSYGFANPSSGRGTEERETADALRHVASKADQPGQRCAVAIYGRTFNRAPHTAVRGNVASMANGRTFRVIGDGTFPAALAAFIVANGGTIVGAPEPQPQPPAVKGDRKRAAVKVAAVAVKDSRRAAAAADSRRGKVEAAAATVAAVAAVKGADSRSRARAAAAAAID